MTAPWLQRDLARFYDRSSGWRDGTEEFHEACARACPPGARILEIGAGADNPTSRFLAGLGELHGVDVDPAVRGNRALRSASLLAAGRFPQDTGTFDLCVSNFVLEHVDDAALHFTEIARVLRPGGRYLFRTPNAWSYVGVGARLTPHWFHRLVANRLRALPPGAPEPFPTRYRANTRAALRRLARGAGLDVESLRMVEKEPSYGMFARPAFLAMVVHERLVNAFERLAPLRSAIFGTMRKPG